MRAFWLVLIAACGGGGDNKQVDAKVADASIDAQACTPGPQHVVFVNRVGGTYTNGPSDSRTNVTMILDQQRSIAPTVDATELTTVLACASEKFRAYNVTFTDQDPGAAAEHTEIVLLDSPGQAGFPGGVGHLSETPTCANGFGTVSKNKISFLVWNGTGNTNEIRCWNVAQVTGINLGLDFVLPCPDLMSQQSGCTTASKTFTNTAADCGEFQARNCNCGGAQQNSHARLLANVGARCP